MNVAAGTSTATENFVGGNAAQNFVGGSRQATNQQGTNRQFQAFQNTQQGMNQGMSTTGTPRQVKTALRIGFSFPNATSAQASGNLAAANQANLSRYVTTRPEFTGINVNMTPEGVAVLTGSTDSVEASRLAANLLRLQPGVRRIDNQLAVNR
ncbi:MAG: BON domain-containing protein [Planctomycetaceae bacterium]